MARPSAPHSSPPVRTYGPLGPEDLRYIRASYVPLAEACSGRCTLADARREIAARRWPGASYLLDDGTEMVPRDHFALLDEAGGADALADMFRTRFVGAARAAGATTGVERVAREWEAYLDGDYAVCLRRVTPEAIFEKASRVESLDALLARPAPDDPIWCDRVREHVIGLDHLVRAFAPCDRARFGGTVTRDRLITDVRRRYPEVFGL